MTSDFALKSYIFDRNFWTEAPIDVKQKASER